MPLDSSASGSPQLSTRAVLYRQLLRNFLAMLLTLTFCLLLGILGYHFTDNIAWIDALHNASMILSGMGPVVEIHSVSGKLFSSFYALFSGVVFITNISLLIAPAIHRLYHHFRLEEET